MTKIFFQNEKTGKRYLVVGMDNGAGTITLQGPHATFTEPYDKERFKRLGYTLVKEKADAIE